MKSILRRYFTLSSIFLFLIGCTNANLQDNEPIIIETESPETIPKPFQTSSPSPQPKNPATSHFPGYYYGLTYQSLDGNRLVPGQGNLPSQKPIDIELPGIPFWVVGAPYKNGIIWFVALEDGQSIYYFTAEDGVVEAQINPPNLLPGMPPFLQASSEEYSLITVPQLDQSPLTHPINLHLSYLRVYINQNGDLEFIDESDQHVATLDINALLDARILLDENDRLLLLTDPTEKYNHGVLGDNLEAASITLIETQPTIQVASVIAMPENEVIEGISPIWVDISGDNLREIIVTVSDLDQGAGIVIFSETGERLAEGPKMGRAYRWRHQIGYARLGPDGEKELAVVRTPHIGGVVEYYKYVDGTLSVVAEFPGITSHTIGSRNLDMAAAGDFDGDGVNELLLPNPDLTELIAVRRTRVGAELVWRLPIDGVMSTNLSGVTLPDGKMAIAVGRSDGVLTLWLPK